MGRVSRCVKRQAPGIAAHARGARGMRLGYGPHCVLAGPPQHAQIQGSEAPCAHAPTHRQAGRQAVWAAEGAQCCGQLRGRLDR